MTKARLISLILILAAALGAFSWLLLTRSDVQSIASSETKLGAHESDRASELEAPPTPTVRSPNAETNTLGQEQKLLAAGVVVDDAGLPVSNALVELDCVHVQDPTGSIVVKQLHGGVSAMNIEKFGSCTSDADGRFVFRGTYVDGTLNLKATHRGSTDPVGLRADPGTEDARLVLHMSGSLRARFVLPGDEPVGGLTIDFAPNQWSRVAPSISTDDSGRLVRRVHSASSSMRVLTGWPDDPPTDETDAAVEPGSGQCAIRATLPRIAPDDWSVFVSIDSFRGGIAHITGLSVRSGAWTDDPRVNPLDLRDVLALVKLTIQDPSGARVPSGLLRSRTDDPKQTDWTSSFEDGASTFYARIGAEFDVSAPGFCTQRVIAADGARTIVLQRGKAVRLVLDGAGVPAPPLLLRVALVRQPVANDRHTWFVVDTQDDERISNLAARSTIHWYGAGQFDGSGSADAKVEGPGDYFACWYVGQKVGPGDSIEIVRILPGEPARVVVPEGADETSIRIHLDPGDLAAAIERM